MILKVWLSMVVQRQNKNRKCMTKNLTLISTHGAFPLGWLPELIGKVQ